MKKLKQIIAFATVLILVFMPFVSNHTFAFTGGLLNGKPLYVYTGYNQKDGSNTTVTKITDNDLNTYAGLNSIATPYHAVWYKFTQDNTIDSYFLKTDGSGFMELRFYNSSGALIKTIPGISSSNIQTVAPVTGVRGVELINTSTSGSSIFEWDVFGAEPDTIPPSNVTSLIGSNITDTGFKISWNRPSDTDFSAVKIYLNGVYKSTVEAANPQTYTFANLVADTTYNVKVTSVDTIGNESSGATNIVKTNPPPDVIPPSNVTNLTATPTFKSVSLSWTNPPETDFAKVKIYEDGVYQKSVTASEDSTAFFANLAAETLYTFKITSVDNTGNESVGSSIQVKTLPLPEVKNIKSLDADAKYDRVKLSWELPVDEYFHHVNIYRKVVKEESFFKNLFSLGATTVYAADTTDEYKPMFETNGTYWTDLTVDPETNYEYKLTSENTDGRQSQGVTVEIATPQEPKPKIEGAAFTKSTNEDYVVSWEEPTTGSIKIFVGGKEYKTVQASPGSYTIPKSDLVYTSIGDPDVKIQPITERGTEGDSISNPKTTLPFSVTDLIESGNALLWLIAPFILLALAFLLVPKFRLLIFRSFSSKDKVSKELKDKGRKSQVEERGNKERERITEKERTIQTERESKIQPVREPKTIGETRVHRMRSDRINRESKQPRESRKRIRETRESRKREREPRESRKPRGMKLK